MLRALLLVYLFSAAINFSHAGDGKGNGGDILICGPSQFEFHNMSLDLYETKHIYNYPATFGYQQDQGEIQQVKDILLRIKSLSPRRFKRLIKLTNNFYDNVHWVNSPLGEILDSGEYNIPKGCELLQVINQNKKILPENKAYLIRKDIWETLSLENKITLILHEVIYLDTPMKTSLGIRKYVAQILGNQLKHMSFSKYLDFLIKNEFNSNLINGALINLKKKIDYYPNQVLHTATPIENSLFHFQNKNFNLKATPVLYHPNKLIKQFCHKAQMQVNTLIGKLNAICITHFGDYTPIQTFANGNIKKAGVFKQQIVGPNYTLFIGSISPTISTYGSVTFYSTGEMKLIKNSYLKAIFKGNPWLFDGSEKISFFKNKLISTGTLKKEAILESAYGNIVIFQNVEFYNSGALKKAKAKRNFNYKLQNKMLKFAGNDTIELHSNGGLKEATIITPIKLKKSTGTELQINSFSRISLDKNGFLL